MSVEIAGFHANSLGGQTWAAGQIVPGKPLLYNGKIDVRDADMAALAQHLPVSDAVRQRLTGTAGVSIHVAGAGKGGEKSPAQTLIADGEWEILHGDFWSVPAVKNVASHVRKPEELGTGDAAGVFHVENNKITLDSAAINSPLLGLQGHGTVGFDKTLDLTVVAAPLGDWRDRMKQTGVPLVGDVMGGVQQLMNAAQGTLLYQYKVTGSVSHPQEALIPVPVVTQPVAYLFGQMIRQDKNADLLGEVKRQAPETVAKAEQNPSQPQPASAHQPAGK
jgi:AsmA-like protein